MKISIAYFSRLAVDAIGNALPVGGACVGSELLTAAGAAGAVPATAKFARIATDTSVTSDVLGYDDLHPANSVEFFRVETGQVITFASAV